MKALLLLIITACLCFIKQAAQPISGNAYKSDSALNVLKAKKRTIDEYIKTNKNVIVLAKVPGKKKLIQVINEKWPDEIEYTYNILRDKSGKVVFIACYPFSESGDWDIAYKHYFDEQGKTYSFQRNTNTFDSDVAGGVIFETITNYYSPKFKTLQRFYALQNKAGKLIKNNGHINSYHYKYDLYKSLNEALAGYHIKLPK